MMRSFLFGLLLGAVVVAPAGAYLFVRFGGLPMSTSAKPLPFERAFARAALHASVQNAAKLQSPLPVNETTLLAGAQVYRRDCAVCHGLPDQSKGAIAKGEYPPPPQLFEPGHSVTDDPAGVTYWKVSNGIRFSGMPGFDNALPNDDRWAVAVLLQNADKMPANVRAALGNGGEARNVQ